MFFKNDTNEDQGERTEIELYLFYPPYLDVTILAQQPSLTQRRFLQKFGTLAASMPEILRMGVPLQILRDF